jgi:hypothetical protein
MASYRAGQLTNLKSIYVFANSQLTLTLDVGYQFLFTYKEISKSAHLLANKAFNKSFEALVIVLSIT